MKRGLLVILVFIDFVYSGKRMIKNIVQALKYNIDLFFKNTFLISLLYVVMAAFMSLFRFAFLWRYYAFSDASKYKLDLLNAFWLGLRFDSRVIGISSCVIIVLHLISVLIPVTKIQKFICGHK